jgi:Domain of unknown function (DUF4160)
MPKLYEYFGLIVLFYSNEHTPIHVHGKFQGRESKAEIIYENGKLTEIRILNVKGKIPLDDKNKKKLKLLVETYHMDIIQKWMDFFVYNNKIEAVKISKKLS